MKQNRGGKLPLERNTASINLMGFRLQIEPRHH